MQREVCTRSIQDPETLVQEANKVCKNSSEEGLEEVKETYENHTKNLRSFITILCVIYIENCINYINNHSTKNIIKSKQDHTDGYGRETAISQPQ